MLSEIIIGREMVNPSQTDLHSHATFSCSVARWMTRIARWFGQKRRF
jgi:hypothetical protein